MPKKNISICISLVALITGLILITSITLLSFSAGFYRNSINWVLEVYTQNVSSNIVYKLKENYSLNNDFNSLKKTLKKICVSANSKLFLLDKDNYIIASSKWEENRLIPAKTLDKKIKINTTNNTLLKKSFKKFLKNEKRKNRKFLKRKFSHYVFWYNLQKYISIYKHFNINNKNRTLVLILPYRDFFKSMTRNNIILYSIATLFIILALLISIRISKRISKPLSKLSDEMEKIRNFELDSNLHIESPLKEVSRMSFAVDNMRLGLKSFKKYVPSDLVKELISLNKEAVLGGEKKNLTIFFSDIANFTSISEKLSPEDLVEILGEYLKEMTEIIINEKGTVDKYIGDSIMSFWGAPIEFSNHAELACRAALQYQQRLTELGKKWEKAGKPNFSSRIGINTGDIIVGNMGYEKRMNYTVIGDPVNLASRLESINKVYGTNIIIGENTYEEIKEIMETRFLDIVAVKGKSKGVKIYELISLKEELNNEKSQLKDLYEKGLNFYLNREFEKAKDIFMELLTRDKEDKATNLFLNRAKEFIKNPPDENWDGVYIAKEK